MTPNFALSLSFEGIRLLHRAAGGWALVGDVSLEIEDLQGALSVLLETAQAIDPSAVTCKLIIPNSQVRYLRLETGIADDAARWVAARAAIDGATPYPVSQLSFDLCPEGGATYVAAVANETLEEAEAFAVAHGFNPVSFVAMPEPDDFPGEPFFGQTAWMKQTHGPGARVERDRDTIVVTGAALMPDQAVVEENVTEDPSDAEVGEPEVIEDAVDVPIESEEDAAPTEDTIAPDADADAEPAPDDTTEAPDVSVTLPAEPVLSFNRQAQTANAKTPDGPVVTFRSIARQTQPQKTVQKAEPAVGFASRRASAKDIRPLAGVTRTAPLKPSAAVAAPVLPKDAVPHRAHPVSTPTSQAAKSLAPSVPQLPQPRSIERTPSAETAGDEAQRLTVFGARQSARKVGGKPRYLGLILSLALIVFLGGVAAWSSVFGEDGVARFLFASEAPVLEPVPERLPASVLPAAEDDQPVESPRVASLGPALSDEDTAVLDALQAPRGEAAGADDAGADAIYARVGVWTRAPDVPQPATIVPLETLYEPSIDRGAHQRESHDAVALPSLAALATDRPAAPASSPAAPGTVFRLDARGLVIPTPEGAINPDGIRVYAGRPPSVPPNIPDRTAQPVEETDPLKTLLAGIRPQTRPQNLVEENERAGRTGPSRTELAVYRPVARPALTRTPQEEEAEQPDAPATPQAVAVSLRPDVRPRNFDRIVARATPKPETRQTRRLPPRTVQPRIPSSASVAQAATVRNALNLSRINLIGVFGSPSDRRALVLFPNGRERKVKVGDALDGGRVFAIGDSELRYQKRGRNLILKMPSG